MEPEVRDAYAQLFRGLVHGHPRTSAHLDGMLASQYGYRFERTDDCLFICLNAGGMIRRLEWYPREKKLRFLYGVAGLPLNTFDIPL